MKKLKFIICTFIFLNIVFYTISVLANTTGSMSMNADKAEYSKNDEVVIEVKTSGLSSDKGIISLGAVLEYDKAVLQYVKIAGVGEWGKPSFNEENGKLVTDRSDLGKNDEAVFKITFKVISDSDSISNVKIKDIEVSGGDGAFTLNGASQEVKIKSDSSQKPNNTNNSKPTNNTEKPNNTNTNKPGASTEKTNNVNTNKQDTNNVTTNNGNTINTKDNIATSNLPKAGISKSFKIILTIIILLVIAMVSFIKLNNITKDEKKH